MVTATSDYRSRWVEHLAKVCEWVKTMHAEWGREEGGEGVGWSNMRERVWRKVRVAGLASINGTSIFVQAVRGGAGPAGNDVVKLPPRRGRAHCWRAAAFIWVFLETIAETNIVLSLISIACHQAACAWARVRVSVRVRVCVCIHRHDMCVSQLLISLFDSLSSFLYISLGCMFLSAFMRLSVSPFIQHLSFLIFFFFFFFHPTHLPFLHPEIEVATKMSFTTEERVF